MVSVLSTDHEKSGGKVDYSAVIPIYLHGSSRSTDAHYESARVVCTTSYRRTVFVSFAFVLTYHRVRINLRIRYYFSAGIDLFCVFGYVYCWCFRIYLMKCSCSEWKFQIVELFLWIGILLLVFFLLNCFMCSLDKWMLYNLYEFIRKKMILVYDYFKYIFL